MEADLIIYALVAAGLVFWLRSILGTRHEDEPRGSGGSAPPPMISKEELELHLGLKSDKDEAVQGNFISDLAANPTPVLSIASKASENGLLDIASVDREFDIKRFLTITQDVFVMVVEGFAAGDRDLLKDLLGDDVYKAFDTAIAAREKAEETQVTEIQSVQHSEVLEAAIDGKEAVITVKFTAEENSITKDKDDTIIAGHPDQITEMIDIWTFRRGVRSKDPRWMVTETRGDFEGDNDLIPDSV